MKHLLWFFLVCGIAGGAQWYFPQKYEPQLVALQQEVEQVGKARNEANDALAKATSDLTNAKEEAEMATKRLAELQDRISQSVAPAPFSAPAPAPSISIPTIDPKVALRDAAKGEKLDQLVTSKGTYQQVVISSVDPAGINFIFADGEARASFDDLDQSWKDRFKYDPAEASAYLAAKVADQARVDADQAKTQADAQLAAKQDQQTNAATMEAQNQQLKAYL